MISTLRTYWWAALTVPVIAVITVTLIVATLTTSGHSSSSASAAPSPATPGHSPTPPPNMCADRSAARSVVVSIAAQHLWACDHTTTLTDTPVTTGAETPADATPTGTWTVIDREIDRYLVGPGYREFVHYWLHFFDDFGFHDAPWQHDGYGDLANRSRGSRGCVHVPEQAMAALYRWAVPGTTVTILT